MRVFTGRHELPGPPVEVADEVELWARESGRHATLRFVPTRVQHGVIVSGTWTVRITLRQGDKRLLISQEERAAEEPVEVLWLHESDGNGGYRPFDLMQVGASGVRTFLEKGNTWSGRGEFSSLDEQVRKVNEQNEQARQKARADALDGARAHARDKRRQVLGLPLVSVAVDVTP